MSYTVGQGSIFGRIGSEIGKGLSEQIPKEVSRNRLASGLQDFQKKSGQLSPVQQIAELAAIPGALEYPQLVQSIGEAAKFQGERNSAINAGNEGNSVNPRDRPISKNLKEEEKSIRENNNRKNLVADINQKLPSNQKGLTTYSPIEAALSDIREPTQQEVFNKRSQILKQNPWMSVPAAEEQARKYFQAENAQKVAEIEKGGRQESIENKVATKQKEIRDSLGTLVNGIPEEVFDRSSLRQQYDVANGATPTQAANKEKKNLGELARSFNSLKNNIGKRPLMEVAGPELRRSIKDLKPKFEQNDELPLFKNTLVNNLDIGDHLASFETWQPGKKVTDQIINTSVNDSPAEIAAKLGKAISGNDKESLFSVGYLLHKIGVDDQAVIDELMNLSRNGLVKLDSRQMQEGSEYYPVEPKLSGDFLLSLGGLIGGPLLNYITGQREKISTQEKIKRKFGGKE